MFQTCLVSLIPRSSLSYYTGYRVRHNLRRSTVWFTVWPNGWAESHHRIDSEWSRREHTIRETAWKEHRQKSLRRLAKRCWRGKMSADPISPKTWSRSPASTHRLTSLQGRTASPPTLMTFLPLLRLTSKKPLMQDSWLHHCLRRSEKWVQIPSVSVFQQAAASGSQQRPASSSVINLWQTSDDGSCGKLQRGDGSSSSVERSLLRGKKGSWFRMCVISTRQGKNAVWKEESSRIPWKGSRTSSSRLMHSSERSVWGWSTHGHKKLGRKKFGYCPLWNQLESQRFELY